MFSYFALYNLLFLGLQLGYIFSKSNSFINTIPLPASVYLPLIFTLFIHLGLYLLLAALQTAFLWGLVQFQWLAIKHEHAALSTKNFGHWHITIWLITISSLITSNGYLFPLSFFSRLFLPELPHAILLVLMLLSLLPLGLLTLNALFFVAKLHPKIVGSLSLVFLCLFIFGNKRPILNSSRNEESNIIFIGVDSLSPHSVNSKNTPTLDRFINHSVFFKETISPLAQTYPAWASILTGLYAYHNNARYNLMPLDLAKSSLSMAWSLQKRGYQTIFATDDRRFNNIGEEFGFQKIIGPKMGANDILLGSFNDFPLSNLLVNLPIGRWLFPYNYLNRASYNTFYPQSFDKVLFNTLASSNHSSPLFMAVHFTLPHWPYAWAESSPALVGDEYNVKDRSELYSAALQRADQQVSQLLQTLQQYGYLENSIVVLLSDHGETLYEKGSRQTNRLDYQGKGASMFVDYLKRKTSTVLEKSVGHGTDLLSTDQFHSVLAFKIYKHKQLITIPKIINTRVALIDIMPTIQSYLGNPIRQPVDGISLLRAIDKHNEPLPDRTFIMESGMLPNQFLTREKARSLGKKFFTIDPQSGLVHLRKEELATLDTQKLYGVIAGNWILALYPDDNGYIPITLNLKDGQWADDLNSDFAKKSPANNMLNYMQQFYHKKWHLVQSKTKSNQ